MILNQELGKVKSFIGAVLGAVLVWARNKASSISAQTKTGDALE